MSTTTETTYHDFIDWLTHRQFQQVDATLNAACRYFDNVGVSRLESWYLQAYEDSSHCILRPKQQFPHPDVGVTVRVMCSCGWDSGRNRAQVTADLCSHHLAGLR